MFSFLAYFYLDAFVTCGWMQLPPEFTSTVSKEDSRAYPGGSKPLLKGKFVASTTALIFISLGNQA